jgi:hypothetical protein
VTGKRITNLLQDWFTVPLPNEHWNLDRMVEKIVRRVLVVDKRPMLAMYIFKFISREFCTEKKECYRS